MNTIQTFAIEDGIPIPLSLRGPQTGVAAAIQRLKPGQSFLVEVEEAAKLTRVQNRMAAAGRTHALKHNNGRRFVTRRVNGGVRMWRVA